MKFYGESDEVILECKEITKKESKFVASFELNIGFTGTINCKICGKDILDNRTIQEFKGTTQLHSWETYDVIHHYSYSYEDESPQDGYDKKRQVKDSVVGYYRTSMPSAKDCWEGIGFSERPGKHSLFIAGDIGTSKYNQIWSVTNLGNSEWLRRTRVYGGYESPVEGWIVEKECWYRKCIRTDDPERGQTRNKILNNKDKSQYPESGAKGEIWYEYIGLK